MTARREPADPLELPAALVRRLAAVDAELPPTPRWRPTAPGNGQLHIVRGHLASRAAARSIGVAVPRRRRSLVEPLVAAGLGIAFFGLGYLVSREPQDPGRFVVPSPAAFGPAATPVASPSGPPATVAPTPTKPRPTPRSLGPEVIRGGPDGATLIARRLGWTCRLHGDAVTEKVDLGMVDKMAVARGIERGIVVTASKVLVSLGTDPDAAAAAFKAFLVAHGDDGSTWIASETGKGAIAHELVARRSPMGRLVWLLGDSEQPVICDPSPGADVPSLAKSRVGDIFGTPIAGFHIVSFEADRDIFGRPS
jgi:hypothetical protein